MKGKRREEQNSLFSVINKKIKIENNKYIPTNNKYTPNKYTPSKKHNHLKQILNQLKKKKLN